MIFEAYYHINYSILFFLMSLVKKAAFCCWDLSDFYLRGQERKNEGGLQAQAESAAPFKMGYRIQDTPDIFFHSLLKHT